MKLHAPFIQLPLQFDAGRLPAEVGTFTAQEWRPHPPRLPGNFALPLVTAYGNPESEAVIGPMRPTPYLERCPYLVQVLARLGAVWGRIRLMRLAGHAEVSPHADLSYYWRERVRVHVPIITYPEVRFLCGDAEVNMGPGECWIFDTWREHRVINASHHERIHLVADTVGSADFWDLVGHGHEFGTPADAWTAQRWIPATEQVPALRFESVNVPTVMTPWELREHIAFLLRDVRPHPQLDLAQRVAARFTADWQGLWAQFGEDPRGWPAYRTTINAFESQMELCAAPLVLINNVPFMRALRATVLSAALMDQPRRQHSGQAQAAARA